MVDLNVCFPKYAKFVKEIAANKDKWFDEEVIPLSNKYNCIIQKALAIPSKVLDPRSCSIGGPNFTFIVFLCYVHSKPYHSII